MKKVYPAGWERTARQSALPHRPLALGQHPIRIAALRAMVGGVDDVGVLHGSEGAGGGLRKADCVGGGASGIADAFGTKIGRFEKSALTASHPSGRMTSRYDSRWPKPLSGPHDSVAV